MPHPVLQPGERLLALGAGVREIVAVGDDLQAQALLGAEEAVDGEVRGDVGPTLGTVRAAAADEQERPGGDERDQLVMVHGKAGLLDAWTEVPAGIPVREAEPDASFTTDGRADALIERGEVERLLATQAVA